MHPIIEKNVKVAREKTTATADMLTYNSDSKKILLTEGPPRIYQKDEDIDAEYSAEQITLFADERKIIMENNVKALIYIEE